ncbi:MAG: flavodoxin family protein [Candidatus Peregrinibacteria bacterium]
MRSLSIIYATGSGHTEYVIETLQAFLKEHAPKLKISVQRAEQTQPEDLLKSDVLLLACGTWNTGGTEGQLHPFMHTLLNDRSKDIDLKKKPCALIALGDSRYYYTARATEHLTQFVLKHNGISGLSPLLIIGEPYGQEDRVRVFCEKLLQFLSQ